MLNRSSSGLRPWVIAALAAFLSVLMLQLVLAARRNSITWDEDDHIYAGYMSWKRADFGLNPEHPPLVKELATLPLLSLSLNVPVLQHREFKHEAFLGGKEFLFKNDADRILFRARMAAAVLSVLLVLLVFLATREMFSISAAFIAVALLVFDPNLLAHGAVVGTDVGLTCFMFAAVYAFYRYVKAPSPGRLLVTGLATGLALASKHTGILVFPMLALLMLTEILRSPSPDDPQNAEPKGKRVLRFAIALVVITALAIFTLWAFYGFRYSARAAGYQMNPPLSQFVEQLSRPREVRLLETVAHYHLLPESYIYGLADVRIMSDYYTSYLFGTIYPHGVWFYFPAAFAIKSSLSFLIFLGVSIWACIARRVRDQREIFFLSIPPAFHLLIAMSAGMNIGLRHILPMYPFLTVLIAGCASKLIRPNRKWIYAVVALLLFQVVSTTRAFPAYIAYANELWGGPSQTYKYLSDSNADWGQQLKSTKKYLDGRGIKDCWFVYFAEGPVDMSYYGIPCKPLPTMDSQWLKEELEAPAAIDGPVLVSAGDLSGYEFGPGQLNPYEQFKGLRPTAVIDYGVFVFEGHFEIPLAASISHTQKADLLFKSNHLPEALSEAQQALTLAPDAVRPNVLVGDILIAMHRPVEARIRYLRALELAKTVEPEFQIAWVNTLDRKLAAKQD